MYKIINERSDIEIPPETMTKLIECYDLLKKEYKMPEEVFKSLITKNLLFTVLLKIAEIDFLNESKSFADNHSRGSILTKRFFELVSQYHTEQRSVSFYADKMFISEKYLSTTIKKTTGRPALAWIHEQVILKAKVMLKTSNMTVAEISYVLNFANPSFFGRLFKKYAGMTPNEYRRS